MLTTSLLTFALATMANAASENGYNTPPTFMENEPTLGIIQGTIATTAGYLQGKTNCYCGPSQIPDLFPALEGFQDQYCGGNWNSGLSVQMQGVASYVVNSTVILVSTTPDDLDYFNDHAANDVRPLDCYTIYEFLITTGYSATTPNGCGGDMSFSCDLSTDSAGVYNNIGWTYTIGIYNTEDQFWVTGNLVGVDPTDGGGYGGSNTLAAAAAGSFYPTLQRLAGQQQQCANGDVQCANQIGSPDAFSQGGYTDDTNPCAYRRSLSGPLPRWATGRLARRC